MKQANADVLIVDDNQDNLKVLRGLLSQEGYRVRIATSGQQALNSVAQTLPDLILLDICMPDMDGYEVCRRLKANIQFCDIPVLFISALSEAEDKITGFTVGGQDYITKPFQSSEVLERIRTHINLCRLRKKLKDQNTQLQSEVKQRKAAQEELIRYKDHLEALVVERTAELVHTEEQERQRLATELHDSICQSLAFMKMKVDTELTSSLSDISDTFLQDFQDSLIQVMEEAQSLTQDLGMPIVHELGLKKAITQWLTHEITDKHQIHTTITGQENISQGLNKDTIALIFRVVRELAINVVKHAQAKHISVSLSNQNSVLSLQFSDDGIGFETSKRLNTGYKLGGYGLFSIKERINDLGGQVTIESKRNQGTHITLNIPYESSARV